MTGTWGCLPQLQGAVYMLLQLYATQGSNQQRKSIMLLMYLLVRAVPAVAASGMIVANSLVSKKEHTSMLESIGL